MNRLESWLLRTLGSILGLAAIGCSGSTPVYGAPPTPYAVYKVSGTVLDAVTDQPVPGIEVAFMGQKVLAGTDGTFTLNLAAGYCTACPLTATDVDGAQNGAYGAATLPLNLLLTGPGDGKYFLGTFEQKDLAIKLAAKP